MKVRFSFFGLGFSSRFAVSAFCYAAAAALYLVVPAGYPLRFFVPVFCAVPLLFLKAKGFSNRPADLGKEDWKPVTMKEIDRLADRVRKVKKVRTSGRSGAMAVTVFFLFAMLFFDALSGFSTWVFLVCIYLILVPWLWFAGIESWYPERLSDKLEIFLPVLDYPFGPAYRVTPMLRFDEDKQGRAIPEDIQVMVEPRHVTTKPYYPQPSHAERFNRNLRPALIAYHHQNHSRWDENLSWLQFDSFPLRQRRAKAKRSTSVPNS
ncbi:MAG: hypothetical protein LBG26_01535 [Treponema sp.]|jgi:hypothetical protein|nr:hypothetical protein [Treponema sp.]